MKTISNHTASGRCTVAQPADPRVRRTRKLLEEAFHSLLMQKPFTTISVQDITERATLNRATFYAHYIDKQDLATSILRNELRTAVIERFDQRPVMTHDSLVEIATAIFEFMEKLYAACPKTANDMESMIGTTVQEELYGIMEDWLSRDNALIRLFPKCSKTTAATVISWSIYGGALRWNRSGRREPAATVCREIVSILLPSG